MTDAELAAFLGIAEYTDWEIIIHRLPLKRREVYERMAQIEREVDDWLAGRGPRPKGILIDLDPSQRWRCG